MKNKILKISLSTAALAAIVTPIATLTSCNKGSTPVDPVTPEQEKLFDITDGKLNGFKSGVTQEQIKEYCKDGVLKLPAVKTIGANAFNAELTTPTPFVTTIEIAASTTSLEDKVFFGATASSVTFTGGVATSQLTSIGNAAFAGCENLTSFAFPAGLYTGKIDKAAFYGCTSLAELDLSTYTGATTLSSPDWAYGAFTGTSATGHVIINSSVSTINRGTAWSRLVYAGINSAWTQNSDSTTSYESQYKIVPNEYLNITSNKLMGANQFLWPNDATFNWVILPDTVKDLDDSINTFFKAKTNVVVWDMHACSELTIIPSNAFQDCSQTPTITGETQKISLPSSIGTVGDYAFQNCKYLPVFDSTSSQLTSIGQYAFDSSIITSWTFKTSMSFVGDYAFKNCKQLNSLDFTAFGLDTTMPTWGDSHTFDGAGTTTAGANIVHMQDISSDPVSQFVLNDKYSTFLSGKGLAIGTEAGEWKFDPDPEIEQDQLFTIDAQGKLTGWAKVSGTELTATQVGKIFAAKGWDTLSIPANVTSIEGGAFYDGSASKIPDEVTKLTFKGTSCTSIGANAFTSAPKLAEVTIPNTVTSIGASAFSSCSELATIDLSDWVVTNVPAWTGTGIFSGVATAGTVKVHNYLATSQTNANQIDQWRMNYPIKKLNLGFTWGTSNWQFDHADSASPYSVAELSSTTITGWAKGTVQVGTTPSIELTATEKENILEDKFGEKKLVIPAEVTDIYNDAFVDSAFATTIPSTITELEFETGSVCTEIKSRAFMSSPLTTVTLPDGLKIIGTTAFAFSAITELTLPASITTVSEAAFYNSGLTTIIFPVFTAASVQFQSSCFADCKNLAAIDMSAYDSIPTNWNDTGSMLDNIATTGVVTVSDETLANTMLNFLAKHSNTIAYYSTWTYEA